MDSTFQKERHIRYFLRCLKTLLPDQYTSNDSNRMTLAYFTVAGLELLGALNPDGNQCKLSAAERTGYINWIYHCQVPSAGGFRGFTGSIIGDERRDAQNECWDPANVPATFFALITLLMLGDNLERVRRKECLRWLRRMQRKDGSFGQVIGPDGGMDQGRDLRFCCCAAGIRYMLRGKRRDEDVEDIDVQKLISYVRACQTYEGGFAESPWNESNAGLTYCAVGTLSFLDRLQPGLDTLSPFKRFDSTGGTGDLVSWLVFRQTSELEEPEDHSEGDAEDDTKESPKEHPPAETESISLDDRISSLPELQPASSLLSEHFEHAGFNGRPNKIADTCYCFWVTGSLSILDRLDLVDPQANRKYLLDKTQHLIGGFGKGVGHVPDLLHSYLGLSSLGLFNEEGLDAVDPLFCTSKRVRARLETFDWWNGVDS